jgi:hypothetical protein
LALAHLAVSLGPIASVVLGTPPQQLALPCCVRCNCDLASRGLRSFLEMPLGGRAGVTPD